MYYRQDLINVELIDHMGTDLSIVNAARVSFHKQSELVYPEESIEGVSSDTLKGSLSEPDQKLIKYLATHKHWSPFAHAQAQFRIKAPIFVARQLVKHQVGLVWNEVSRRYVTDEPTYYYPDSFRAAAQNVKQGSSTTEIITEINGADGHPREIFSRYEGVIEASHIAYMQLVNGGVAAEIARAVLPLSTMTEWIWTGSLYAFARVCNERLDPHAQLECQMVAKQISEKMHNLFPVSWTNLVTIKKDNHEQQ